MVMEAQSQGDRTGVGEQGDEAELRSRSGLSREEKRRWPGTGETEPAGSANGEWSTCELGPVSAPRSVVTVGWLVLVAVCWIKMADNACASDNNAPIVS